MQIVSITTNILVRGMGIPYGRKYIRDAFVLWWKPIIIVHDKKGINMPKIITSYVVGINECGKRPTKFVGLINKHYKYFCSGLPFIVMNGHYLFCCKLNQSLLNRNHAVIHESSVGKLSLFISSPSFWSKTRPQIPGQVLSLLLSAASAGQCALFLLSPCKEYSRKSSYSF